MYWTLELASYLSDAPWPATKDELIDYSIRTGAPLEVVENLQAIEDEGDLYESIQEIYFSSLFSNILFSKTNIHEGTPARLVTFSFKLSLIILSIFLSQSSIKEILLLGVLLNSAQKGILSIKIADKSP